MVTNVFMNKTDTQSFVLEIVDVLLEYTYAAFYHLHATASAFYHSHATALRSL